MKISRPLCALVLILSFLSAGSPLQGSCDYYGYGECPWSGLEWEKVDTLCNFDWDCWFIFKCKADIYKETSTGFLLRCERGCACIFGNP